ncbi:MAG: nicotinamide-nucleotide amidohydrolase family protein [Pseudomonadota bacterium]
MSEALFSPSLRAAAEALLAAARRKGLTIATAESCTGGLIAGLLTDIPGSSDVVDRGFVTYSNRAKSEMLGVAPDTLARFGAVSAETAAEMAAGALERAGASLAVSVTGVAGPGGGSPEKPVGLVWFGLAAEGQPPRAERQLFPDEGRTAIRLATVAHAVHLLSEAAG